MGALRVHIPDEGRPTLLLGRFSPSPAPARSDLQGEVTRQRLSFNQCRNPL